MSKQACDGSFGLLFRGVWAVALLNCAEGAPIDGNAISVPFAPAGNASVGSETAGASGEGGASAGAGGSLEAGGFSGSAAEAGGTGGVAGSSGVATSGQPAAGSAGAAGAAGSDGQSGSGGSAGSNEPPDAGPGPQPVPTGVALTAGAATEQEAPSDGGGVFSLSCSAGEVLIGYQGTMGAPGSGSDYLRTLQGICGTPVVSAAEPYEVDVQRSATLTAIGDTPGSVAIGPVLCPESQVLVGFGGHAGMYLDHLELYCAALMISSNAADYELTIENAMPVAPVVGGTNGSAFTPHYCPAGQLAVGHEGRAGGAIDAFGLSCATASLVIEWQ